MEKLWDLAKKYPSDRDLGEYLREKYKNDLNTPSEILEMINTHSNDYKLGETFRSLSLNS